MKAKHTPGPWQLNTAIASDGTLDTIEHERYVLGADGYTLVADCYADTALELGLPDSFAQAQANATLITAAPDLLTAAKQALSEFVDLCDADEQLNQDKKIGATMRKLQAAITKAKVRE